jgi:hypothetical protein
VISETDFQAVQATLKNRAQVGRGRKGKHVHLFAGLLKDARTGGSMGYRTWDGGASITSIDARRGRESERWNTFPAAAFDDAVLSQLAEVTVSDVEGESNSATNKVDQLSAFVKEAEARVAFWTGQMDNLDIAETVVTKLAQYNRDVRKHTADLEAAQREAASPVAEAVGGMRVLIDLLRTGASDETKLKVRAAIRRVVESVHVQVVDLGGRKRAGVVLVKFVGAEGRFRLYVIRPTADGYAVDPPSRTWLTNTLDIRTAEGRDRAERFVRELAKRAEETSQAAKVSEVGTGANTGRSRLGAGRGETVAGSRAAPDRGAETGRKRPVQRRKVKR